MPEGLTQITRRRRRDRSVTLTKADSDRLETAVLRRISASLEKALSSDPASESPPNGGCWDPRGLL
jgi:hypothetical protein